MADFDRKKYQTDAGNVFFTKMDINTQVQAVAGDEPEGEPTENMTCLISQNNREAGLRPRYAVYGRALGGDNVDGARYVSSGQAYKKIAILTPERYAELNPTDAPVITIGDVIFRYKGKFNERIK